MRITRDPLSTTSTGRTSRPRRYLFAAAATAALLFASVLPAAATLPGSSFESADGNLVVNTSGNLDWVSAPNLVTGIDTPTGTSDNAFGQGTKEDVSAVTVVTGSIPPNKNDLQRFYVANNTASNGDIYLYLAWERLVNIGNANLDFEINQKTTTGFTASTTGAVTLNRTPGDLLVSYDFGGSGTPTLGLSFWITSANGAASDCFSSNSLPCWGKHVTLGSGVAEGAVNTATIAEPIIGGGATLGTGLFGEAGINLTAAGVFPAGVCEAFGSTFVKSRSSSSFTAEVKDFIAPQAVNISNCGSITVNKVTQNAPNATQQFGYTTGNLTPSTFSLVGGGSKAFSTLSAGTYTVTEGAEPTGWDFVSLSCTDGTNTYTGSTYSGTTATIILTFGQNVVCTYTNHYKFAPTIATVLVPAAIAVGGSVHDTATLSGASATAGGTVTYTVFTDTACSAGAQAAGVVTVNNGVVPISNTLTFTTAGDYYWQAVYSGDANNSTATSACTSEHLVVSKASPSATTAQTVLPNDSFALSGGYNATGTVTFKLFAPADATCSGSPAYTAAGLTLAANGTAATSNSTFIASTEGTWRWLVTYSGDTNNNPVTKACGVEQFTILNH
jgi:hypothetical protein